MMKITSFPNVTFDERLNVYRSNTVAKNGYGWHVWKKTQGAKKSKFNYLGFAGSLADLVKLSKQK